MALEHNEPEVECVDRCFWLANAAFYELSPW